MDVSFNLLPGNDVTWVFTVPGQTPVKLRTEFRREREGSFGCFVLQQLIYFISRKVIDDFRQLAHALLSGFTEKKGKITPPDTADVTKDPQSMAEIIARAWVDYSLKAEHPAFLLVLRQNGRHDLKTDL